MFAKIPVVAITLFAILASVIRAAPFDVYTPRLLKPAEGDVWIVGKTELVTWDTSNPPEHITNGTTRIVLANKGRLDYNHPLATGFNILDGRHYVKVPRVKPGSEYQLVLFGDSGNYGPKFSIRYKN